MRYGTLQMNAIHRPSPTLRPSALRRPCMKCVSTSVSTFTCCSPANKVALVPSVGELSTTPVKADCGKPESTLNHS